MNFEPSFLNSVQFNKNSDCMVGGYTYPTKPKPNVNILYDKELLEYKKDDLNKKDTIGGGGNNSVMQVPIGLVVNKYDDNMSTMKGTYKGVIDIQKINEFLDLNYKPLKLLTRKIRPKHNLTTKKR